MATTVESRTRTDARRVFPAYGPIDAALGYWLFYVLVDRATPTVVDVLTDAIPSLSPSQVGFGLALLLWFVLVVTVVDQVRRQLWALGVLDENAGWWRRTVRGNQPVRVAPSGPWILAYLVGLAVGGFVAYRTFDAAIETAVSLIRIIATLDVEAFDLGAFLVMIVFFVAFNVAARSLDRLVIGGVRFALGGARDS